MSHHSSSKKKRKREQPEESTKEERKLRLKVSGNHSVRQTSRKITVVLKDGDIEVYQSRKLASIAFKVSTDVISGFADRGYDYWGNKWEMEKKETELMDGEVEKTVRVTWEDKEKGLDVKITNFGRHWNNKNKSWTKPPKNKQSQILFTNGRYEKMHNLQAYAWRKELPSWDRAEKYGFNREKAIISGSYRDFRNKKFMGDHRGKPGDDDYHHVIRLFLSNHSANVARAGSSGKKKPVSSDGHRLFQVLLKREVKFEADLNFTPKKAREIGAIVWKDSGLTEKQIETRSNHLNREADKLEIGPAVPFKYHGVWFWYLPDPLAPSDKSVLLEFQDKTGKTFIVNPLNGAFKTISKKNKRGGKKEMKNFTMGTIGKEGRFKFRFDNKNNKRIARVYATLLKPECAARALDRLRKEYLDNGVSKEAKIEDLEVDHIDHNTLNNALSNLRWLTKKENAKHRRTSVEAFEWKCVCKDCVKFNVGLKKSNV